MVLRSSEMFNEFNVEVSSNLLPYYRAREAFLQTLEDVGFRLGTGNTTVDLPPLSPIIVVDDWLSKVRRITASTEGVKLGLRELNRVFLVVVGGEFASERSLGVLFSSPAREEPKNALLVSSDLPEKGFIVVKQSLAFAGERSIELPRIQHQVDSSHRVRTVFKKPEKIDLNIGWVEAPPFKDVCPLYGSVDTNVPVSIRPLNRFLFNDQALAAWGAADSLSGAPIARVNKIADIIDLSAQQLEETVRNHFLSDLRLGEKVMEAVFGKAGVEPVGE